MLQSSLLAARHASSVSGRKWFSTEVYLAERAQAPAVGVVACPSLLLRRKHNTGPWDVRIVIGRRVF